MCKIIGLAKKENEIWKWKEIVLTLLKYLIDE